MLFADNMELNSDAGTLFFQALRQGGGIAALEYNLRVPVRLPAVTIISHVDAREVTGGKDHG